MAGEGLEARVAALENQVSDLAEQLRHTKQDAAAARVLAGGADRDVTEIRRDVTELRGELRDFRTATVRSFNAMREEMNERFARVDAGFVEMRGKFDAQAAGQAQIVALLTTLIDRDADQ